MTAPRSGRLDGATGRPGRAGAGPPSAAGNAGDAKDKTTTPVFSPFDLEDLAARSAIEGAPARDPGRPAAKAWRPIAVSVQLAAWGRRPWAPDGRPPIVVYAPDKAVRARLDMALRPAWDVRPAVTLADLVTLGERLPPETPVVYAPNGTEADAFRASRAATAPGDARPGGAVGPLGAYVGRVLRTRPAVVYGGSPEASTGVPSLAKGLPMRPVFDASRVPNPTATAHLDTIRLIVARAAADHVAHEVWARLVEGGVRAAADAGADPEVTTAAAGRRRRRSAGRSTGRGDERISPLTNAQLRRRSAEALRRLFLRPDAYPDVRTLADAVGLADVWLAEASRAHFGVTRLRAVHDLLLAFHATRLLADAQARPREAANALGLTLLPRLNVLVRAATGMTPQDVHRWGITVEARHLLETVLATSDIPTRRAARGTSHVTPQAGRRTRVRTKPRAAPPDASPDVVGGPQPASPPRWLAPDPGVLPEYQAEFPRFPSTVLPEGHPYAWSHPRSPYHTGVRPPVSAAPSLADRVKQAQRAAAAAQPAEPPTGGTGTP